MRRALELARAGWGQTAPNPMVGAVVVRDGRVIAEGCHARFGAPHAEVVALAAAGDAARGAALYVTLEPCAHQGATPPCADAIIAAGVARVVIAATDPNPVAAGGVDRLRAAGIAVEVGDGANAAHESNAAFFHRFARPERPFVTLKLAVSIDGAIAAPDRAPSIWLTGPESRREVHRVRAGHDAIAERQAMPVTPARAGAWPTSSAARVQKGRGRAPNSQDALLAGGPSAGPPHSGVCAAFGTPRDAATSDGM